MDAILSDADEISVYYVALYAMVSFLVVAVVAMILYVACSRKYKLNWFEKNLLERAETEELEHSQEALVPGGSVTCIVGAGVGLPPALGGDTSGLSSSRTLNLTPSEDAFWVPQTLQRQNSEGNSSADESLPSGLGSPSSHLSTNDSGGDLPRTPQHAQGPALPLARGAAHVVLSTTNPARPKVASMQAKLDHTKIDTSLYQKVSPSRTPSLPEELRGSLHLTLVYDPAAGILTVRLIEAHDLQARDFSGTADPYAKIRLLPDRSNVWQTRIHKRTLNPVFDEDFVFEVRPATIGRRTLEILLYDFDAYSRHLCIGGVQLALAHIDLSERVVMWKGLGPCSEQDAKAELGDLMVSLAYLPSAERLTVVVVKARNLRVIDDTRISSDPYVKVSLINGSKRLKKRKTSVHRNTVSPVFNEALTFDVTKDTLKSCIIEFCILHDSLLGASEVLGRAVVGNKPEIRPEERDFFAEMFRSKTATAQWLPLSDTRTPL